MGTGSALRRPGPWGHQVGRERLWRCLAGSARHVVPLSARALVGDTARPAAHCALGTRCSQAKESLCRN